MEEQRDDLHTGSVGDPLGMNKVFAFSCPYLGTLEDSDTSLAYPAADNHCFKVDSPTAVDFSHQEAYCLSDQHPGCHVFQMANAALADTEPEVEQTAPPKKVKRRLSLYALPIILVLLLLAAIIWWPAPGTTIQESLVRGAQNNREVSGGATLAGKTDSQPAETDDTAVITVPETVVESTTGASLNGSAEQEKSTNRDPSATVTDNDNTVVNVESEPVFSTDMAPGTNQPAEAVEVTEPNVTAFSSGQSADEVPIETEVTNEETTVTTGEETNSTDVFEDSADSPSTVAPVSVLDETVAPDVEEETDQLAVVDETDESEAVVTSDLPVISSDTTTVAARPEETVRTNDFSQTVVMVGPVASTALSLVDVSEESSFLPVYQDAAGGGALLSQIESRRFVTLLGRDSSGEWLNIRLENGIDGWINANQSGAGAEAVVPTAASQQSTPAATSYPVIRYAHVDTGALNLRSGPGVGYEAFTILSRGEIVGLIGRRALGPWVRIRMDGGTEGWLNSSLLAPLS